MTKRDKEELKRLRRNVHIYSKIKDLDEIRKEVDLFMNRAETEHSLIKECRKVTKSLK